MAPRTGKGFLLVLMDCPPTLEDEFNAWYDTEHLPERLAVPGFETAIRFVCLDGHPKYLAMYDLERPEVLDSAAYMKVAHDKSSPWTKRVTSRVRVYRSAGLQILGGSRPTRRAPRVTLLRFRALGKDAGPGVVAAVGAAFEGRPETEQVRVMAYDTGKGVDYLGFIEASAPFERPFAPKETGALAQSLDLVNTYAAY